MLRLILTAALLAASFPAVAPTNLQGAVMAAHHINLETKTDADSCSATAVGSHTLLTAAHCMLGTYRIVVDGKDAQILATIYDGEDHELIVTDLTFATILKIEQRPPNTAEHVRMFGFPGNRKDLVSRDGYFEKIEDEELYIFILPVFPGDSGAAIISDTDSIIGIVSMGNGKAETAAFLLAFTPSQLAQVK